MKTKRKGKQTNILDSPFDPIEIWGYAVDWAFFQKKRKN